MPPCIPQRLLFGQSESLRCSHFLSHDFCLVLGAARTTAGKAQIAGQMEGMLSRLLLVAERYPELKSNQNFLALQDELAGTENRIAVERRRYNQTVRDYNTTVRRFPTNLVAGFYGFERSTAYFEAAEGAEAAPSVEF